MGTKCCHDHKTLIKYIGKEDGLFFYSHYCDYRCKKCFTGQYPTIIRVENVYLKFINFLLLQIDHTDEQPIHCEHRVFFADHSTTAVAFFDTICEGDINLRSSNQITCNSAIAECARCQARFHVRCGYKEDPLTGILVASENWKRN